MLNSSANDPSGPSWGFCLSLNDAGVVVLTCPQVPELMVLGDTEEEAVIKAIEALQMSRLAGRVSSWLSGLSELRVFRMPSAALAAELPSQPDN